MVVIVAGSSVQLVDSTTEQYRQNGVNVCAAYDFRGLREQILAHDNEHVEIVLIPEHKDRAPERKKEYRLGYSPEPCRCATIPFPSKKRFS